MAIIYTCTECGLVGEIPDDAAGKRGKCPRCDARILIPAASSDMGLPDIPPLPTREAPPPPEPEPDLEPASNRTLGLMLEEQRKTNARLDELRDQQDEHEKQRGGFIYGSGLLLGFGLLITFAGLTGIAYQTMRDALGRSDVWENAAEEWWVVTLGVVLITSAVCLLVRSAR